MENHGRTVPSDARIHEPAILEDWPSAFALTEVPGSEGGSGCDMKLEKSPSLPSEADSMEQGSKFDNRVSRDQHRLVDNEISDANHIPPTAAHFQLSPDRPLFPWRQNLGPDIRIEVCSERTASLTTATTIVSDEDPDFPTTETPLHSGATENGSFISAQPVTSDLARGILDIAQFSSSAHHSRETLLRRDGNSQQDPPSLAKKLPGVVRQLKAGENRDEKEIASLTEHRGETTSSHQKQSSGFGVKRKGGSANDDSNDNGGQKFQRFKTGKVANSQRLWACPFAKGDPWRHPRCLNAGQDKISYVKQHLRRIHGPVYCTLCGKSFSESTSTDDKSAEGLRDKHQGTCHSRTLTLEGKMTYDQERAVKEAKSRDMSDEERWYMIFDIVCPGAARPDSPYAQPVTIEVLGSFRTYLRREIGHRAVRAAVAGSAILYEHHLERYFLLVQETVSNFVRRLEELDHSRNDAATTKLTISPSELELRTTPGLVLSESSTASTVSTLEIPMSTSLSSSASASDMNTTLAVSSDKSRYEFKAGVQNSCEGGKAARQQNHTGSAPSYVSEAPAGEVLDAYYEPSLFPFGLPDSEHDLNIEWTLASSREE